MSPYFDSLYLMYDRTIVLLTSADSYTQFRTAFTPKFEGQQTRESIKLENLQSAWVHLVDILTLVLARHLRNYYYLIPLDFRIAGKNRVLIFNAGNYSHNSAINNPWY